MVIGDFEYEIQKQGMFSGRWTCEQGGQLMADAEKPSAMFRTYEITSDGAGLSLVLKAESAFKRSFEILRGQEVVGRISPIHAFTRRATIQCSSAVPEQLQLFSFWLVGLAWKRAANRHSNDS